MGFQFRSLEKYAIEIARLLLVSVLIATLSAAQTSPSTNKEESRPRVRDVGVKVGILPTGPLNTITDVAGVMVGQDHRSRRKFADRRHRVLPHNGKPLREKFLAQFLSATASYLMGSTQISEWGEIETPILLTSTLSVPRVADALLDFMLSLPGNEQCSQSIQFRWKPTTLLK